MMVAVLAMILPTSLSMAPATASVAGAITLDGFAQLTTGFGLPVLTNNTANFSFASNICVDFAGGKKTNFGAACQLFATGTVTGACGLSAGAGTGVFVGSDGHIYTFAFVFTSESETMTIRGAMTKGFSGQTGTLHAEAVVTPWAGQPGSSCTNKTATTFYFPTIQVAFALN